MMKWLADHLIPCDQTTILDLLAQGGLLLTPNNRLSHAFLQKYFKHIGQNRINQPWLPPADLIRHSEHRKESPKATQNHEEIPLCVQDDERQPKATVIDKPLCLPYKSALIHAYQKLVFLNPHQEHPVLINTHFNQFLWKNIIQSSPHLTDSEGLLHPINEAWQHAEQWQISPEHPAFQQTQQTQLFQHWWQTFNHKLRQLKLISECQLATYLINTNACCFPPFVIWACFDELTPEQLHLQQHLNKQGIQQYGYDLATQGNTSSCFAAQDTQEEHQQLLSWVKLKLKEGKQRIGVIIPTLQQDARALKRLFKQHISDELFNITLGEPLAKRPIISHALTWLSLPCDHMSSQQTCLLLQSPYTHSAKNEFLNRSQCLQDNPLMHRRRIPLKRLIKELSNHAPKLGKQLAQLKPYPQTATPSEWIALFEERLNTIGFPGDSSLSSENYQAVNRFISLFDELRPLCFIAPKLTINQALDTIKQLAQNTVFQAEKANTPIQISGLLEASGCEFDCLWVTGVSDQYLPQKNRLSPFIPHSLQKTLNMPHSTPEKELLFARQTLQRLKNGCPDCVFSYSKLKDDNPNLPSRLIASLPSYSITPQPSEHEPLSCSVIQSEDYLLPLTAEETYSGGTALLANQAKCPFKAFAQHRLQAKPLLTITEGAENKERGQMAHKVMELLWQQIKSQQHLIQLSPKALEAMINSTVETAFTSLPTLFDSLHDLSKTIEYERLKKIASSCLEWEKQRPSFTIAALEQSHTLRLGDLTFKVRIDRLDQVDHKKWVIDYKSSLPGTKPWHEDRPQEPQLLLYALLDDNINTLLFLQLKSGSTLCSGLSELPSLIQGISSIKKETQWDDYKTLWHDQLNQLATEFHQGHCPPDPVHLSICQSCDFQSLCRFQAIE